MNRHQEQPHQRQVYATQYSCRQCRFTTIHIEHIRRHVNGHMLEAALNFHSPTSMVVPTQQQLRERNLFFNPFRQLLPTLARPTSETHRLRSHRSLQRSEATMSRSLLQNRRVAAVARESTRRVTEETCDPFTMPLIDQLSHPIPVIIDLVGDQTCDDDNQLDLSLRL